MIYSVPQPIPGCGKHFYEVIFVDKIWKTLSYVLVAALATVATLTITMDPRGASASKLDQLEALIEECYVDEVDQTAIEDAAAAAMVKALGDRWSYYIPAAGYASHMEQMNNAYVGIGVTITVLEDGSGFEITKVEADAPAQEAGVLPGDILISIEGQTTRGMSSTDARNLVRGEAGSFVRVTVLRDGEEIELSIERRQLKTVVATGKMLEDNVGLVSIANFDARCAQETLSAVEALLEQGAEALIFDVRGNPGGYADEMVKILDYLLPEGPVFTTVNYAGKEQTDVSDEACLDMPMAVLVNAYSYSAAEFFAAALQEYDAAIVVGEQTSGKGYFQSTFELNDGSAVGLSIGKYYTPKGKNLEGVGITPDVELPLDALTAQKLNASLLTPEEDPQIRAAMKALTE